MTDTRTENCLETIKIYSYQDGELKKNDRLLFVEHLQTCETCASSLKKLRSDYDIVESLIPVPKLEEGAGESVSFDTSEIIDSFYRRSNNLEESGIWSRLSKAAESFRSLAFND